jgi:hypothetical protein
MLLRRISFSPVCRPNELSQIWSVIVSAAECLTKPCSFAGWSLWDYHFALPCSLRGLASDAPMHQIRQLVVGPRLKTVMRAGAEGDCKSSWIRRPPHRSFWTSMNLFESPAIGACPKTSTHPSAKACCFQSQQGTTQLAQNHMILGNYRKRGSAVTHCHQTSHNPRAPKHHAFWPVMTC